MSDFKVYSKTEVEDPTTKAEFQRYARERRAEDQAAGDDGPPQDMLPAERQLEPKPE